MFIRWSFNSFNKRLHCGIHKNLHSNQHLTAWAGLDKQCPKAVSFSLQSYCLLRTPRETASLTRTCKKCPLCWACSDCPLPLEASRPSSQKSSERRADRTPIFVISTQLLLLWEALCCPPDVVIDCELYNWVTPPPPPPPPPSPPCSLVLLSQRQSSMKEVKCLWMIKQWQHQYTLPN